MHLSTGIELAQVYDALPNLFQAGRVKWDLALAINGVFDHRRISAETILAEVHTWGVIAQTRASALVSETLDVLDDAITEVAPPKGVSDGMIEHLQWNVRRLLAGQEISEPRA